MDKIRYYEACPYCESLELDIKLLDPIDNSLEVHCWKCGNTWVDEEEDEFL